MRTTTVRVTTDREKRYSCSAPVPDTYEERAGQEIQVYLPPVEEVPEQVKRVGACQSRYYWRAVTDDGLFWWLCEHAVDID